MIYDTDDPRFLSRVTPDTDLPASVEEGFVMALRRFGMDPTSIVQAFGKRVPGMLPGQCHQNVSKCLRMREFEHAKGVFGYGIIFKTNEPSLPFDMELRPHSILCVSGQHYYDVCLPEGGFAYFLPHPRISFEMYKRFRRLYKTSHVAAKSLSSGFYEPHNVQGCEVLPFGRDTHAMHDFGELLSWTPPDCMPMRPIELHRFPIRDNQIKTIGISVEVPDKGVKVGVTSDAIVNLLHRG